MLLGAVSVLRVRRYVLGTDLLSLCRSLSDSSMASFCLDFVRRYIEPFRALTDVSLPQSVS